VQAEGPRSLFAFPTLEGMDPDYEEVYNSMVSHHVRPSHSHHDFHIHEFFHCLIIIMSMNNITG
jgi:hypothetical protein